MLGIKTAIARRGFLQLVDGKAFSRILFALIGMGLKCSLDFKSLKALPINEKAQT
jgi:hypothetical protein